MDAAYGNGHASRQNEDPFAMSNGVALPTGVQSSKPCLGCRSSYSFSLSMAPLLRLSSTLSATPTPLHCHPRVPLCMGAAAA